MAKKIINYRLESLSVSNPDNSKKGVVTDCNVVNDSIITTTGTYSKCLDFGAKGFINTKVSFTEFNSKKFCVRIVFKAGKIIMSRENLVESTSLPFAIFIDKGSTGNDFELLISIQNKKFGWQTASINSRLSLKATDWYDIALVYDFDTLGLFINGNLISINVFPVGEIATTDGEELWIGRWTLDGRYHFGGRMAIIEVFQIFL
ncbi:MAG: hypothetical protein IPN33_10225 [Saprospiraceae bacterium]|nr:hypothetical protein [Saprospiraceae bacterium]